MKVFLFGMVLIILCASAYSHKRKEEMQKILEECLTENGASEQNFRDYVTGKLNPVLIDEKLKCSMHCVMVENDFMDDAGKFDSAAVKRKFEDDDQEMKTKIENALEKCEKLTAATPCETAYTIFDCMIDHDIKMED